MLKYELRDDIEMPRKRSQVVRTLLADVHKMVPGQVMLYRADDFTPEGLPVAYRQLQYLAKQASTPKSGEKEKSFLVRRISDPFEGFGMWRQS